MSEKAIAEMINKNDATSKTLHSQIIDLENQVKKLQQQVHRLQSGKDALKTVSELLKKASNINLQQLSNRKKARNHCSRFHDSRKIYGYRRVNAILQRHSIVVSEKVVRRIMKEESLKVFKVKIRKYNSYKGEISPAVPNLIHRDFHADGPNQKWLTDITEFHILVGKVYLSPVIDCFDGLPVVQNL